MNAKVNPRPAVIPASVLGNAEDIIGPAKDRYRDAGYDDRLSGDVQQGGN